MVSKTKRALALVLTAMMAASALAGCGGGSSNGGDATSSNSGGSTGSTDGESTASLSEDASLTDINDPGVKQTIISAMADEAKENGGKIKLTLWCSGDDGDFEKSLVEDFKKEYESSDYTLDVKVKTSYGEDKAGGKIIESPKDGADVFNIADDQLTSLVAAKAVAEVGELFQSNVVANNTEDAVAVCSVDNTAYAFPKTSDNGYFMYYDKRFFNADEVDNLDDMIKKAGDAGKSVYFSLDGPWYNAGFFFAAGCTIEYDAVNRAQTATFNTPEGLKAGKAICHVAESAGNGLMGTAGSVGDNAAVQQGFKEGKLVAAVIGTWCGPAIKEAIGEENVGAAKLPTVLMDGEQVQLHSFGGYKIIGVNAFTKYPVAAQTLAYYLSSADSQLKRYETRGLIPTNKEALENETIKNDPALQAIEAQRPYAHAQGKAVGSIYWSASPGTIGSKALDAKGKLSDEEIQTILQNIVTQMEGDSNS